MFENILGKWTCLKGDYDCFYFTKIKKIKDTYTRRDGKEISAEYSIEGLSYEAKKSGGYINLKFTLLNPQYHSFKENFLKKLKNTSKKKANNVNRQLFDKIFNGKYNQIGGVDRLKK